MKPLHRLFHPSAWSLMTLLSTAMLGVTWTPILLLVFARSHYQNHYSVWTLGAIATLIPLLLAGWLLRPMRRLTKAAKAVERGNFAPPALAEISQAQNDIGYLARVFAKMVAKVKAAQEQHMSQQITDVMLRELNHGDIQWLGTVGHCREIGVGTVLTQAGRMIDTFHLVLDGCLAVTAATFEGNYLDRVYAQDDAISDLEVARLGSGEVVGESLLTGTQTTASTTIKALKPSLVLSISQAQLVAQLKQDVGFAARFYRAIAVILSNRLQTLIGQMGCNSLTQDQPLRDVLSILGALNDSDIDWLVAIGQQQKVPANSVLIHQSKPIEALYILLDGILMVSTFDQLRNPFVQAFSVLDADESGQEITRLSKGEMVGETLFLNAHLPPATITALQDSLVLAIPRSHLAIKLEQDIGFASRFYRMLANLLSNRLQELLDRLGYGQQVDDRVTSLNGAIQAEDELNFNVLDQMAIAGTRFDWMLRRLGGIEAA
ncbi:cyclic nucleotide-binding domain-containing protein [Phormidium sp. CLA17]|uniref:cyclic nucleotide-binding domain-containing protein n=1 Tax=Leptolyngbya sp. Cla-17 TaxID=2803751 RepID=UPI001491B593|nr:cyclic nucleotide-binding domain-containing protein [Leptolyngbya sp. Cla-17]MBM0745472.1 cyclic nucleotide-binding domain-containing protein [Leptolyngbya sp. Cla-17]